ncbi:hypothetical protein ACWGB8_01865 [Kitasatospora sp. NPDC054939]
MGIFARRDRMRPEPFEIDDAQRIESNRQQLIREDPDAAQILTTNAVDAHRSWKVNEKFTAEVVTYSGIKHRKGEGHRYQQLFA